VIHVKSIPLWIRRNPVAAFYIICFVVSWGLWLPLILTGTELAQLPAVIGLFGPALACVIVARTSTPSPDYPPQKPFRFPFIASWIVSTLVFSVYSRATSPSFSPFSIVVFAVLALVPAYIIASAVSGPSGVRRALSSLVRPRGWWGWYVIAVALPLASRLASVWVSKQLGWEFLSDPQPLTNPLKLTGAILVIFLYTILYAGGLNEETGWTGLALPRLQARYSPLVSTLVIWALWMLWHVPMHLSGYFELSAHVLIGSFFGRFLLTWLFIRSKGGVLTAILLHTSVNVTSQFVPLTNASLLFDLLVALLVFVGARMWRRLPQESPAVFFEHIKAA
jgi:membrane protease YdiL (CAAX protease family)